MGIELKDNTARVEQFFSGAFVECWRNVMPEKVLDYPAVAEALLPTYQERIWLPIGDTLFLREGRYNHLAGRIEMDYILVHDGKVEKRPWTQRVYTYLQVCELLTAAGFVDPQSYASPTLEPFKLGSRGLLLVATRKR
jgi:hypothetical protein